MTETHRIKVKIGQHEFDAEGPLEAVQHQFEIFKEMVAAAGPATVASNQSSGHAVLPPPTPKPTVEPAESTLHKIMKSDDKRVVSLTVRPKSIDEAVLLILLGQKEMMSNDSVTGGAIMEGLTATGGLTVARIDRLLEKLGNLGDVIVIGEHRSKRYRLTNAGVSRAREIAETLIALVP